MRGYTLLRNVRVKGGSRLAIFRFEAKIISRGGGGRSTLASASYRTGKYANTGKSAVSAAAYRAGAELVDERTGQKSDYTNKKGVMGAAILLPAAAPAWMQDRSKLWNGVEKAEKRKDAQLARDFILTLPHELSHTQRVALTQSFVREQFVAKGYAADIAWHSPQPGRDGGDGLNHHAHVMVPLRRVEPDGFAKTKERPANGVHPAKAWKDELAQLRQAWEDTANAHLGAAGLAVRIDCRSNAAQGIDRVPEPKMGSVALEIERDGRESFAGRDMRAVRQHNAELRALKVEHAGAARAEAEIIDLQLHRLRKSGMDADATKEAATAQQPGRIVDALEELRAAEEQARATLRGEAEATAQRAEALKSAAQREAEQAARDKEEHAKAEERRAHEGKIGSAEARYAIALGENYHLNDPYGSLGRAAMSEGAMFQRRQMELGQELAEAATPAQRQEITLRREIEANEYMGLTSHRLAGISEAIGGEGHKRAAILEHERGDAFDRRAQALRDERAELLQAPERQQRAEVAASLGSLAQEIERGTLRDSGKQGQADGRNQPTSAEAQPAQEDAATPAGRPREAKEAAEAREAVSSRAGGQDYSHLSEEKQAALAALRQGFAESDQRNREAGQSRNPGRGR